MSQGCILRGCRPPLRHPGITAGMYNESTEAEERARSLCIEAARMLQVLRSFGAPSDNGAVQEIGD